MSAELWAVLVPLFIISVGLIAYALLDLRKRTSEEVVGGNRGSGSR